MTSRSRIKYAMKSSVPSLRRPTGLTLMESTKHLKSIVFLTNKHHGDDDDDDDENKTVKTVR